MIGSILLPGPAATAAEPATRYDGGGRVLYGPDLWRVPHDPNWTESGTGLASEFGYGDDGAKCVVGGDDGGACGWIADPEGLTITNGVLGYERADVGADGSFLKIGVGKLVKGSCGDCNATDGDDVYRFNSPYVFAEDPVWIVTEQNSTIEMTHEAVLDGDDGRPRYGYRVRKTVRWEEDGSEGDDGNTGAAMAVLTVRTELTNLGPDPFVTPWYSHHFFTCDGIPMGRSDGNYGATLSLRGGSPLYGESGVGIWSQPLADYADVGRIDGTDKDDPIGISVTMREELEEGVKIKAEFPGPARRDDSKNGYRDDGNDGDDPGTFALLGCGARVTERTVREKGTMEMYAFNLYAERGTLSPEPMFLIRLGGGESEAWTQRLEIDPRSGSPSSVPVPVSAAAASSAVQGEEGVVDDNDRDGTTTTTWVEILTHLVIWSTYVIIVVCAVILLLVLISKYRHRRLYPNYRPII